MNKEWEIEFDEAYGDTDVYPNDLIPKNDVLATHYLIKSFIRRLLHSHKEELIKKIEGMRKNGLDGIPPEVVRSMPQRKQDMIQGESLGYNQALTHILNLLNND